MNLEKEQEKKVSEPDNFNSIINEYELSEAIDSEDFDDSMNGSSDYEEAEHEYESANNVKDTPYGYPDLQMENGRLIFKFCGAINYISTKDGVVMGRSYADIGDISYSSFIRTPGKDTLVDTSYMFGSEYCLKIKPIITWDDKDLPIYTLTKIDGVNVENTSNTKFISYTFTNDRSTVTIIVPVSAACVKRFIANSHYGISLEISQKRKDFLSI